MFFFLDAEWEREIDLINSFFSFDLCEYYSCFCFFRHQHIYLIEFLSSMMMIIIILIKKEGTNTNKSCWQWCFGNVREKERKKIGFGQQFSNWIVFFCVCFCFGVNNKPEKKRKKETTMTISNDRINVVDDMIGVSFTRNCCSGVFFFLVLVCLTHVILIIIISISITNCCCCCCRFVDWTKRKNHFLVHDHVNKVMFIFFFFFLLILRSTLIFFVR